MRVSAILLAMGALFMTACGNNQKETKRVSFIDDSTRIVSVNGATSEILAELGLSDRIVGVDVSSTFPAEIAAKPKIGHNRKIAAEGVLSLRPTLVIGTRNELNPDLENQLKGAGIKLLFYDQVYSVEGTKQLINGIADSLGFHEKGMQLIKKMEQELSDVSVSTADKPRVLFVYARGAGTMMVAGEGTQVEKIIDLAGGENAAKGFTDFKPLTPEGLVAANPEVILLFDSGLESLGGVQGLEQVTSVMSTDAGKHKRYVTMDGELLTAFGPRLGLAIKELSRKIHVARPW